jgi:hypothetical protein
MDEATSRKWDFILKAVGLVTLLASGWWTKPSRSV